MKILIAGGTGLVGGALSQKLLARGHQIHILSRTPTPNEGPAQFFWDLKKGVVDPKAYEQVDAIVNLAGAGVADKRWTREYKKQILESRIHSAQVLLKNIPTSTSVKTYVSASGIASYGIDTGDEWMSENFPYASDFLAQVVQAWEKEALKAENLGIRTICLRTAVVLSGKGGALPKIALPMQMYVGAPLGTGSQYLSWIDIEDLTDLYIFALENPVMRGIYNAAAPTPVTNEEFTKSLAQHIHKPLWLPNIPSFALKLAVGEMAVTLLGGNRVSSRKVEQAGFVFRRPTLLDSLQSQLP